MVNFNALLLINIIHSLSMLIFVLKQAEIQPGK